MELQLRNQHIRFEICAHKLHPYKRTHRFHVRLVRTLMTVYAHQIMHQIFFRVPHNYLYSRRKERTQFADRKAAPLNKSLMPCFRLSEKWPAALQPLQWLWTCRWWDRRDRVPRVHLTAKGLLSIEHLRTNHPHELKTNSINKSLRVFRKSLQTCTTPDDKTVFFILISTTPRRYA